jgi:uncharacterized protein (TIGR03086 family)
MDTRVRLHREAVELLDTLVGEVRDDDLGRATPCAGWSLGDLLAHEVGQHVGFAQAVRDGDAPVTAYVPVPFTPTAWRDSVEAVLSAFAEADPSAAVFEREISEVHLPFSAVVGAQLLDVGIHTWDVARSLGREFTPPDHLVDAIAVIAIAVPDSASGPGGPFAAPLRGEDASRWEQTLRRLGRDPGWTA